MEDSAKDTIAKPLTLASNFPKLLIAVIILTLVAGTLTGFVMANKGSKNAGPATTGQQAKVASEDNRTFRDFAEGTIKAKPEPDDPSEYTEGTHTLERAGAVPVALTSSVVDLSKYENKKVKVYGETQKALREGWLMDVGRVEEVK